MKPSIAKVITSKLKRPLVQPLARCASVLTAGLLMSQAALATEKAILVLDASGSMWGQIDGRSKVEIARNTIAEMTHSWPADTHIGLVAYGHRRKGDCDDIETLIAPAALNREAFLAQVNRLNAKGKTPLSASVRQAAEQLKFTEDKATVILVSDGEETCDLDPCQVGQELSQLGVDFTAHVVGFDIEKPEQQAQLRCLAENTGGRYFNARDGEELGAALNAAVQVSTSVPPPAEARLMAVEQGSITQEIVVEWEGPADASDYITVVLPEADTRDYLDYDSHLKAGVPARFNLPPTPGDYELRYVSPIRESSVLARRAIKVVEQSISVSAPSEVMAGTKVAIDAYGPAGNDHWIGFAPAGSDAHSYVGSYYVRPQSEHSQIELSVPGMPGEYEIRYVLNENQAIAASSPITVKPATATLQAPQQAMAGDRILVKSQGPVGGRHWVGFADAGSVPENYVGGCYERPKNEDSELQINVPTRTGTFELRYVLNEHEAVIASQMIEVTEPEASITVPESTELGQTINVQYEGPVGEGHWIAVVPKGEDYNNYSRWAYVNPEKVWNMPSPEAAGEYDLVFIFVDADSGGRELNRSSFVVSETP